MPTYIFHMRHLCPILRNQQYRDVYPDIERIARDIFDEQVKNDGKVQELAVKHVNDFLWGVRLRESKAVRIYEERRDMKIEN